MTIGGSSRLPRPPVLRAQDVGDRQDPEPRAAADRDAALPAAAAGDAGAQRGAAPAPPGGAAAAAPGQHAR